MYPQEHKYTDIREYKSKTTTRTSVAGLSYDGGVRLVVVTSGLSERSVCLARAA